MKKYFLLMMISLAAGTAGAQNYELVKNLITLTQYQVAKKELDKIIADPKFIPKPEAYILKAAVYASLATEDAQKNTVTGDQLTNDGDIAFHKFTEMDPAMALLSDEVFKMAPMNLYSSYYTSGYNDYVLKKWNTASLKMKKAVEYSDLLIQKKLVRVSVDTNVLILAGITAENAGLKDEAAKYYGRLADKKITGSGFESVYRFLVKYYFQKNDMGSFEKYKDLGAGLYPKSEYFTYDKVDFAVALHEDLNSKLKALEDVLATDPDNFKANQVLGELIYDELNPADAKKPMPANADELEKRMVVAFKKAGAVKQGAENPFIYMGDHFIKKSISISNAMAKLVNDEKRLRELNLDNYSALSQARESYEKVASIFAVRATLSDMDKKQYKKTVGYLVDIASTFKEAAKAALREAKPESMAETAAAAQEKKFTAEHKKWSELYDTIK